MFLVFSGIQGCGKGTQARILVEKYGFQIVEMGGELRKISKEDSDFGREIKTIIEGGGLVPPEMITKIIEKVVKENLGKKMIFDGFIRNMGNKRDFESITNDYKVVFFELSKEKAIERLLGRMYDPETQETFRAGTSHNPKTGNTLVKRKDDNEDSVLKRINLFVSDTLPIVELQKAEGKVISINADQSVEEVEKEIKEKLGL